MGRERAARWLGRLLLTLGALVVWVLLEEQVRLTRRAERPGADGPVGGIGLGAVTAPAWSFHALDPRLEVHCDSELWPIAGAPCFAPDHMGPLSQFAAPGRSTSLDASGVSSASHILLVP